MSANQFTEQFLLSDLGGEEHFISTVDRAELRVISIGQGPTVICAPGLFVSVCEWGPVASLLVQNGYRVILFDQRGQGKSSVGPNELSVLSMARDYKVILDYFELSDVVYIGHSMGVFLLNLFLVKFPEEATRLTGCVFVAGHAGDVTKNSFKNKIVFWAILSGVLEKLMAVPGLNKHVIASFFGKNPQRDWIQALLSLVRENPHKRLNNALKSMARESYYDDLKQVSVPVRLLVGSLDEVNPPKFAQRMQGALPNADISICKDAGHMLNWEHPEKMLEAVQSFQK